MSKLLLRRADPEVKEEIDVEAEAEEVDSVEATDPTEVTEEVAAVASEVAVVADQLHQRVALLRHPLLSDFA